MIDAVDERLRAWLETLLASASLAGDILFAPPTADVPDDNLHIHLHLMRVTPELVRTNGARTPLRLRLVYLVAVSAADVLAAHRALGEIAFAALEMSDLEVRYDTIADDQWVAVGVLPQPAVIIEAVLERERVRPDAPLVRAFDAQVGTKKP